jgi:tetratricopeptide (TPR) repeat protein
MCDNEDLKVGYMKGEVANKMGSIYLLRGEKEKSIQYQKQYLEWAKASTDKDQKKNEMEAHSSLGKSYLAIGKLEEAQEHYEQYLDIAKEQNTKSLNSQVIYKNQEVQIILKKNRLMPLTHSRTFTGRKTTRKRPWNTTKRFSKTPKTRKKRKTAE